MASSISWSHLALLLLVLSHSFPPGSGAVAAHEGPHLALRQSNLSDGSSDDGPDPNGNSDLYGLGIRLGFYVQLVASILAEFLMLEDDMSQLLEVNSIFMTAIAIALVVVSSLKQAFSSEIFVMLSVFFGTLLLNIPAYFRMSMASKAGTAYRLWLAGGMTVFSGWFWFEGVNVLSQQDDNVWIFLFARVSAKGPALIFFRVLTVVLLLPLAATLAALFIGMPVLGTINLLVSIPWLLRKRRESPDQPFHVLFASYMRRWWSERFRARDNHNRFESWHLAFNPGKVVGGNPYDMEMAELREAVKQRRAQKKEANLFVTAQEAYYVDMPNKIREKVLEQQGFSKRNRAIRPLVYGGHRDAVRASGYWVIPIYPLFIQSILLIYTIIAVEFTLRWNNFTGVYSLSSTGQFIPFFTGFAGLALVILHAVQRYIAQKRALELKADDFTEGKCCGISTHESLKDQVRPPERGANGPGEAPVWMWIPKPFYRGEVDPRIPH